MILRSSSFEDTRVGMSSLGPMLFCCAPAARMTTIANVACEMDCDVHHAAPANRGRKLSIGQCGELTFFTTNQTKLAHARYVAEERQIRIKGFRQRTVSCGLCRTPPSLTRRNLTR